MVQCLRLRLPVQGAGWGGMFPPLVGEIKSHVPRGQKTETENRKKKPQQIQKDLKKVVQMY